MIDCKSEFSEIIHEVSLNLLEQLLLLQDCIEVDARF